MVDSAAGALRHGAWTEIALQFTERYLMVLVPIVLRREPVFAHFDLLEAISARFKILANVNYAYRRQVKRCGNQSPTDYASGENAEYRFMPSRTHFQLINGKEFLLF